MHTHIIQELVEENENEDMDEAHAPSRDPRVAEEEREGVARPVDDDIEKELMTDSDAAEFEDEKPKKISLKDSIADCITSCKGSDGCITACKNVMKPMPTHTIKKRVMHVQGWEREKEKIIKNCLTACSSSACKKSCTDPNNVPAPKPTAEMFDVAMTEQLYEVCVCAYMCITTGVCSCTYVCMYIVYVCTYKLTTKLFDVTVTEQFYDIFIRVRALGVRVCARATYVSVCAQHTHTHTHTFQAMHTHVFFISVHMNCTCYYPEVHI
jgi:hypothetical protein